MQERTLDPRIVITALGIAQILGWGTSFYFPAVFAGPITAETGWPLSLVAGGTSLGLLVGGLVSPRVGVIISRRGGRAVLIAGSLFYAVGLTGVGLSTNWQFYLASWAVVGLGMGAGLYDATFAVLGRMYGERARGAITSLTLFGGFSSTVCWPLSAFLIETVGWREACFAYALLHLIVALPLVAWVTTGDPQSDDSRGDRAEPRAPQHFSADGLGIFILLAVIMSSVAAVGAILVVHLLVFLQARGQDFAAAVALGTLFGPAQVGARVVDRLFGSKYHPIWTLVGSCLFMAIGLGMLYGSVPALILIILIYGGGYGVSWVARGTVPLALYGAQRYPVVIGRLAFPSLIVQAAAPAAGAWLIENTGADATLGILTAVATINVVLVGCLLLAARRRVTVE